MDTYCSVLKSNRNVLTAGLFHSDARQINVKRIAAQARVETLLKCVVPFGTIRSSSNTTASSVVGRSALPASIQIRVSAVQTPQIPFLRLLFAIFNVNHVWTRRKSWRMRAASGLTVAILNCARAYDELVRKIAGLACRVRLAGHDCHRSRDLLSSDSASAR
jgi:hypothetical protein